MKKGGNQMNALKLYKIPYSDGYYLGRNYNIYTIRDGEIFKLNEIGCQLYNIPYNGKLISRSLPYIVACVRYGYCDPLYFNIDYKSNDIYNTISYVVKNITMCSKIMYINGTKFVQSPRWDHLYANEYGAIFDSVYDRFRCQKQDRDGYCRFSPDKSNTNYAVHRFVYECWHQIILSPDMVIHHKNSTKTDNFVNNLELTTSAQNTRYSILNHERNLDIVYNIEDINKMCLMMVNGKTYRDIALEFNIDPKDEKAYKNFRNRLNLLRQHKSCWVDISTQYDFSGYTGNCDPNKRYSSNDILEMHRLRKQGWQVNAIANKFAASPKYVSDVLNGKKRRTEFNIFDKGSTTIERVS